MPILFLIIRMNSKYNLVKKERGGSMNIEIRSFVNSNKNIEQPDLNRIMDEHKHWLEDKNKGKRADLSHVDFSDMDLSGMDFSYADMRYALFMNTKLNGTNLSFAELNGSNFRCSELNGVIIDGTDFTQAGILHSPMNNCKGKDTKFFFATIWDNEMKNSELINACFLDGEVCDVDFTGSNLEHAMFDNVDLDNTIFANTNLKNASFNFAVRTYWCDFRNADMTGVSTIGIDMDSKYLEGVKGLYRPMFCPEEGSFVAWKKCREGKVVKLLIPEWAARKGYSLHSCRASEAFVLEIYDEDGNEVSEAYSIIDPEFEYITGETVFPKDLDPRYHGDITGIYFELSRAETERYSEEDENEDDVDSDYEDEDEE